MPTVSYVNEVLATFSDYSYRTALVLYLVAMVAHLGEYARTRAAAEPARVAVPAGAPAADAPATGDTPATGDAPATGDGDAAGDAAGDGDGDGDGPVGRRPRRSRAERFGRTAVALTVLAAALHVASLALRGAAVVRWPWGNMYEFTSAICAVAVVGWLVLLARAGDRAAPLRRVGAFVLLPVVVLMFLAGTVLYADAAPVMPALRSYWLAVHVTAASVASGLLLIAGVASVLFLVRGRRPDDAPGLIGMLPTRETLDRVAYRVTVVAFPIWTFAIMTGAIWAEAAWGRFWGWDPKETVAFVAWVVYAGYLHARATAGWRGGGAAWVNSVGFAVMLFNLFFVNLVTTGLHSYAGVS